MNDRPKGREAERKAREDRLARALRANLRKRKAAAGGRTADAASEPEDDRNPGTGESARPPGSKP